MLQLLGAMSRLTLGQKIGVALYVVFPPECVKPGYRKLQVPSPDTFIIAPDMYVDRFEILDMKDSIVSTPSMPNVARINYITL